MVDAPGPLFHPDEGVLDRLDDLERRLTAMERTRWLQHASVKDGAFKVFDDNENERARLGLLSDGSFGLEIFDAAGKSVLAETLGFGPGGDFIATQEGTSSSTYGDLATTGPDVDIDVGSSGRLIVLVGARIIPGENATGHMSYAISGATTRSASDEKAYEVTFVPEQGVFARVETGLNAGSHTVTAKYRRSGPSDTVNWENRVLVVFPF